MEKKQRKTWEGYFPRVTKTFKEKKNQENKKELRKIRKDNI